MDVFMFGIKALLGLLGTLIIVFLRLTGVLPKLWFDVELKTNADGIKQIDDRIKELEKASAERAKKIEKCRKDMDLTAESSELSIREFEMFLRSYEMEMQNEAKELESLRKRRAESDKENSLSSRNNWIVATALYVVIGSFLAAFLAPTPATQNGEFVVGDVWQVVVWGAGWVALVSLVDITKLEATKKQKVKEALDEFEKDLKNTAQKKKSAEDAANIAKAETAKIQGVVRQLQAKIESGGTSTKALTKIDVDAFLKGTAGILSEVPAAETKTDSTAVSETDETLEHLRHKRQFLETIL